MLPLRAMLPTGMMSITVKGPKSDFGHRLEQALEFRNLKAQRLAGALGVGSGTVSKYGGRVMPREAPRIAELLGVSLEWLTTGKGSPNYREDWTWSGPGPAPVPKDRSGTHVRMPRPKAQSSKDTSAPPHFAAGDDPYIERQIALVSLRPHIEDDDRVRDSLLMRRGPPYDGWKREQWEAFGLEEMAHLRRLDAMAAKREASEVVDLPARAGRPQKAGRSS